MSETRKLAAILVSDVVGYSRLASRDEELTLARLRALRSDLIDPIIAVHHGRIVKRTGDGAIVEFRSVVDAVRCAIEVQTGMAERNAGLTADRRVEFRIGIHLGDVIEEADGDLMGDGVNIAARLEGICEPGGLCLSGAAYEQVRDRVKETFIDLGEKTLKNIVRPVRAYALTVDQRAAASEPSQQETPSPHTLPDKPSIAVLPFQNMSGDDEQEYFTDGMVEEIITALSRFKELYVIARNSSFIYKGRSVDIQQVARELGVRYVLEGSVRKASNRVRITGQLIDAATRAHLWADKFDGALEDVFELQDRLTENVIGALVPSIERAEIERARRKPPVNLGAYDYLLRALPHALANTGEVGEAISLLTEALRLDPNYAYVHAMLANCYGQIFRSAEGQERNAAQRHATTHARRALALGDDDGAVLTHAGWILFIAVPDVAAGRAALDKAVRLNPNLAIALAYHSLVLAMTGEPQAGIQQAYKAVRLNPVGPSAYLGFQGLVSCNLAMDRYDDAAEASNKTIEANPRFPMGYVWAMVAECARGEKGQAELRLRQLREILPNFTLETLTLMLGMFPAATREKVITLLRSHGMIGRIPTTA
jgi:adenylate cyclase